LCAGGVLESEFWAPLGPGGSSHIAHPAIAIAGSTISRALDPPNDDQTPPAIALLSTFGAAPFAAPQNKKSRTGFAAARLSNDESRCTGPPLRQSIASFARGST